jgi:putative YhbY family RNA-binding protein
MNAPIELTSAQRRALKAEAHPLKPVVIIGQHGLSETVIAETDRALAAHGLIKVRILDEVRDDRNAMLDALCSATASAAVQHIGKTLVLWRPKPIKTQTADEDRMPGPKDVKVLKYSKRGGQRPEVKTLRVLGNQRLTAGGKVKRSKPKQISEKKRSQT